MIPLEIQSFHLLPDKGRQLAFPKGSGSENLTFLIELCRQEVDMGGEGEGKGWRGPFRLGVGFKKQYKFVFFVF